MSPSVPVRPRSSEATSVLYPRNSFWVEVAHHHRCQYGPRRKVHLPDRVLIVPRPRNVAVEQDPSGLDPLRRNGSATGARQSTTTGSCLHHLLRDDRYEMPNLRGLRVITINTTKHMGCIAEIKLDKAFHQCLINSVAFKTRPKCSSQIGLMHVAHSHAALRLLSKHSYASTNCCSSAISGCNWVIVVGLHRRLRGELGYGVRQVPVQISSTVPMASSFMTDSPS